MQIRELEALLNLSRDNIRFYEKQGLLAPRRGGNRYRDYSEEDVRRLKQIVILRKCGVPIADIRRLLQGEAKLPEVLREQTAQLQAQAEQLQGALSVCRQMAAKETSLEGMDEEHYFALLTQQEAEGIPFADLRDDFLAHERGIFENLWRYAYLVDIDLRDIKWRYGTIGAALFVVLLCVLRGLGQKFLWHGSFLEGFTGPFLTFLLASALLFPMFALKYRHPVAAKRYGMVLTVLALLLLVAIALLLVALLLNPIFSFWG
ncbi:MAG: MerR family transcriptional regulator [Oscillospiraceae bacterium]|nr:MerR family transcriptional regulator [Oscillospiraceae bacterium]